MGLQLCHATEADADEIASLHILSFNSNVLLHAQFPTPESLKGLHTFLSQDAIRDLKDPGKALVVVRDTEAKRIAGFAKWDLPSHASDRAEIEWPEGCQQHFLDGYYEKADAAKKRVVGDTPCYCKSGFLPSFYPYHPGIYSCPKPQVFHSACIFQGFESVVLILFYSFDIRWHSHQLPRTWSWDHAD